MHILLGMFVGLLAELSSVVASCVINYKSMFDATMQIPKSGYKVNKDELNNLMIKKREKIETKTSRLKLLLLFLPGINIVHSLIARRKLINSMMKDPELLKILEPMSESEKEKFDSLKNDLERTMYLAYESSKENEDEEFKGMYNGIAVIVDYSMYDLKYYPLPYKAYSYEEMKTLAESTHNYYKIGNVDGRNIAIIDMPKDNCNIKNVRFFSESYSIEHEFHEINEEDAHNKKFVIFPFSMDFEENENLKQCYEELMEKREKKESSNNFSTYSNLDFTYEESNGLVLKLK